MVWEQPSHRGPLFNPTNNSEGDGGREGGVRKREGRKEGIERRRGEKEEGGGGGEEGKREGWIGRRGRERR